MSARSPIGGGDTERLGVIGVGILIVVSVAAYLALKSSFLETTATGALLPYQELVRTMASADQGMFEKLQTEAVAIENARARSGQWPDAAALTAAGDYRWTYSRDRLILNYLATPAAGASSSAWLLMIQEPDPQAPVDRAPNDETHHRLPDGTVLHVTVWTHRFGGQVKPEFLRQPETAGWTQVLRAPVPPVVRPGNAGN